MQWDFAMIEDHKWTILIVVGLGALALYLYWQSGQSSNGSSSVVYSTGTNPQVQAAQIAADAQTEQMQYAAASQSNNLQANLEAQANQITGKINVAQIQAQIAALTVSAQQDVTNKQTAAQLSAIQTQVTGSTQLGLAQAADQLAAIQSETGATVQINAQNNDVQMASITSQQQVLQDQIESALAAQESNNQSAVNMASIVNSATTQQDQINANLQLGLANANSKTLISQLADLLSFKLGSNVNDAVAVASNTRPSATPSVIRPFGTVYSA